MRRIMKRLGAVAVILLLLSGCTQQAVQKEQEEQPRTMSMVIASDAPTSIQLAAQEFANRLAYYSDGELEVLLSASHWKPLRCPSFFRMPITCSVG